jgi:hypothetical protein
MAAFDQSKKSITLGNGVELPAIGFGCAFGTYLSLFHPSQLTDHISQEIGRIIRSFYDLSLIKGILPFQLH